MNLTAVIVSGLKLIDQVVNFWSQINFPDFRSIDEAEARNEQAVQDPEMVASMVDVLVSLSLSHTRMRLILSF